MVLHSVDREGVAGGKSYLCVCVCVCVLCVCVCVCVCVDCLRLCVTALYRTAQELAV